MEYLINTLPEMYRQVCCWKNSDNQLAFGKVKGKRIVANQNFYYGLLYNVNTYSFLVSKSDQNTDMLHTRVYT